MEVKMTRNVMKKAIAAIALVVMGGAVLFLGAMVTFGAIAALGW